MFVFPIWTEFVPAAVKGTLCLMNKQISVRNFRHLLSNLFGAWGSVVVKALRH
jgi:hypothetical protein